MDWYLLLTPLVALAVVLLLGFAGCDALFGLQHIPASIPLVLRVRVPAGLTVAMSTSTEFRSGFRWKAGGATVFTIADMPTSRMDGTDTILEHHISNAEIAMWHVECELTVREGTIRGTAIGSGDFMVEQPVTPAKGWAAEFTAAGRPSTPDTDKFRIDFMPGRVPE
jgi:hypothetical protein